jgi:uncharacterized protein YyaL (SSP411 family)
MHHDRRPFFAGSYFPKRGRLGMPGLIEIATQISTLWKNQRQQLDRIGEEITRAIQPKPAEGHGKMPGREALERAYHQLSLTFDPVWGGFGKAPKFPTPHNFNFLMRWHKREPSSDSLFIVEKTLNAMRFGGIFDQIGFGFHRYSVDEKWLVPHFEKMLYDQALLALAYIDARLVTGREFYSGVAREIFQYVMRDMQSPEGGFYSAEDADSEGREGVFYTWTPAQVEAVLGKETGEIFCRAYGITQRGNFEDEMSIAHVPKPLETIAEEFGMTFPDLEALLEECRGKLFVARERRVHPHKDDKILASWNGLMIAALARGSQAFGDPSYAQAARKSADFILQAMQTGSGRLLRRYRSGEAVNPGFADDYAFLIWGLLDLYETVFDVRYLAEAVRLQEAMSDLFWDIAEGGFFFTGRDNEQMIIREKPIYDGAIPSSNSVAALNLLRLGRMTGNSTWEEQADRLMRFFASQVAMLPPAYTHYLQALDFTLGPSSEIVVAGDPSTALTREMISSVHRLFLPNRVLMVKEEGDAGTELEQIAPFTGSLRSVDGAAAYVCENFQCKTPISDPSELGSFLQG